MYFSSLKFQADFFLDLPLGVLNFFSAIQQTFLLNYVTEGAELYSDVNLDFDLKKTLNASSMCEYFKVNASTS